MAGAELTLNTLNCSYRAPPNPNFKSKITKGEFIKEKRMNAIELLKSDHDVVDRLFQKVKATEESEHPPLFKKIYAELEVHMHIEETIFYPHLIAEGNEELVDITKEGIEEHHPAASEQDVYRNYTPTDRTEHVPTGVSSNEYPGYGLERGRIQSHGHGLLMSAI
jgi:hypothetical protein